MHCRRCGRGAVPKVGRAHRNDLCCKCDRISNGPQTEEEKAEKESKRGKEKLMAKNYAKLSAAMQKAKHY